MLCSTAGHISLPTPSLPSIPFLPFFRGIMLTSSSRRSRRYNQNMWKEIERKEAGSEMAARAARRGSRISNIRISRAVPRVLDLAVPQTGAALTARNLVGNFMEAPLSLALARSLAEGERIEKPLCILFRRAVARHSTRSLEGACRRLRELNSPRCSQGESRNLWQALFRCNVYISLCIKKRRRRRKSGKYARKASE